MANQINVISSEPLVRFHFKFLACSRCSDSLSFANTLRTSNHKEKAFSRSVEKFLANNHGQISNLCSRLVKSLGMITLPKVRKTGPST